MGIILSLLLSVHAAFASPYFTTIRSDQNVPKQCRDFQLNFFSFPIEKFFVGRKGALSMGFTFEYPIERSNARVLWMYFRSVTLGEEDTNLLAKIKNNPRLERDYEIILRNYQGQGFDFEAEGEILEILAIEALYKEFPENMYFITGGVEYHEEYSPMTIGELDLYVGRRDDCTSIAVGEAKLGRTKTLKKAKEQINRFGNFLRTHDMAPIENEYVPNEDDLSAE